MEVLRYPNCVWSLPLLFTGSEKIESILDFLFKETHLKVNDNFIYYGHVRCQWGAGRLSVIREKVNLQEFETKLKSIREKGIIPSFTFSNYHLKKKDLNDEYCNQILDLAVSLGCQFIVSSSLLCNHIRKRYPDAFITCSIIKYMNELTDFYSIKALNKYYNKMIKKFNKIVISLNPDQLDELRKKPKSIKNTSNIELMVNHLCPKVVYGDITQAMKTYTRFEQIELGNMENKHYNNCCSCAKSVYERINSLFDYTEKELDFIVNELNFKHLKIQGRDFPERVKLFIILTYVFNTIGPTQDAIFNALARKFI